MTEAQDIIHQIEYRWHDRRDLSPIASTMSPDSLRGWDSWVRAWVRHPHADGLGESVCYQVQPNGRAAIAWRYEDRQTAERADGSRGRPLVSRVLAGQVDQLTPEVAIALCHTGLPGWTGPPPGAVATDADLATVPASALTRLAREQAPGLDQAAAAQQNCLLQVIAAALADSRTPIAVHLPDADILKPPGKGLPCLLLWGLWRTVRPVLGSGGRGWSFSTFELPLGDVDPGTMPEILFRQAQHTPRPVARPRKELKLRLFEPNPPERSEVKEYVELAAWLLAEYHEVGGDGLRRLVESWQGADKSAQPRISRIYEELRAKRSPATPPGPVQPGKALLPDREWRGRWEPKSEPMRIDPVLIEPVSIEPVQVEPGPEPVELEPGPFEPEPADLQPEYREETEDAFDDEQFTPHQPIRSPWPRYTPGQDRMVDPVFAEWQESAGKHRSADALREQTERYAHEGPEPEPERSQRHQSAGRRLAVSVLLKNLPEAESQEQFHEIVRDILDERSLPDYDDRRLSRREISKPGWYSKISARSHPDALIDILAGIFEIVIIQDLDLPEVTGRVAEWADEAEPFVIAGLLAAARQSGDDSSWKMMEIIQQRLAYRWMLANDLGEFWYNITAPPHVSEPNRGGWFNFRGRG